jgi:hypothetical protein
MVLYSEREKKIVEFGWKKRTREPMPGCKICRGYHIPRVHTLLLFSLA